MVLWYDLEFSSVCCNQTGTTVDYTAFNSLKATYMVNLEFVSLKKVYFCLLGMQFYMWGLKPSITTSPSTAQVDNTLSAYHRKNSGGSFGSVGHHCLLSTAMNSIYLRPAKSAAMRARPTALSFDLLLICFLIWLARVFRNIMICENVGFRTPEP